MFVALDATMDRLQAMSLFVRVAEAGSFSGVASQMDVARSVVTRQITALESHLGVKLISRSTRRLSLTPAGNAYLDKCREILDLVEEVESDLAQERAELHGHMRISASLSFGVRHLMPLIADFIAQNSGVTLELDFSERRVNLIEEGIDLALRISWQPDATDVVRPIAVCRSVVVASPEYLARHGHPLHPTELAAHECFGYLPSLRSSWPLQVAGQVRWFAINGRVQANNVEALMDAALRGLCITHLPTYAALPEVEAGRLEVILREYPTLDLSLYAVFPGARLVPQRVRALVDFLAARIGANPYWDTRLSAGAAEPTNAQTAGSP
jgi:DNA-binding transcriptional LysR family regulator